jgi:hypothetical protein
MDLTDVYRVLHPGIAQYIFLSNPWNFLQIRTYLGMQHKSQQIKKMEIIPCILSGHNSMWNKMGTHQQKQQQKILEQLEVEQYIAQ